MTPRRVVSASTTSVATSLTRSRASSTAPTYTRPARSATLRPCLAVVRAAVAFALAASRVLFCAVVRVRRPVVFVGDLRAVERDAVLRDALRVVVLLRAVLRRVVAPLLLVVVLVVVAMWRSAPLVASQGNDISSKCS